MVDAADVTQLSSVIQKVEKTLVGRVGGGLTGQSELKKKEADFFLRREEEIDKSEENLQHIVNGSEWIRVKSKIVTEEVS